MIINTGGPGGIIVAPYGLQAIKNVASPLTHLVREPPTQRQWLGKLVQVSGISSPYACSPDLHFIFFLTSCVSPCLKMTISYNVIVTTKKAPKWCSVCAPFSFRGWKHHLTATQFFFLIKIILNKVLWLKSVGFSFFPL